MIATLLFAALMGQSVETASRDDCEVMLAPASGAELGWSATSPAADFFPEISLSPGTVYRYDCDWAALGFAKPVIGNPDSKRGFVFTRPTYAADRQSATLEMTYFIAPHFLQGSRCHVKKVSDAWKSDGCQVTVIT